MSRPRRGANRPGRREALDASDTMFELSFRSWEPQLLRSPLGLVWLSLRPQPESPQTHRIDLAPLHGDDADARVNVRIAVS